MHQHRGSVALLISQLAMRHSGGGKDGIAVFTVRAGFSQPDNQIFNQLRKMSSTLFVAKLKVVQFFGLLGPRQPVFDDTQHTALQYRGHPSAFRSGQQVCE